MNRRTDRQRKRGSLTVEASLVVPMCVMILALLLSLTFYVYLRCWYTQTACEEPCRGADMAYWRDEADRRKQRKNGKQGAGRVDFPDRMLPVE